METYITFSFWVGCLGVILRSIFLLCEHPRVVKNSVGADTFGLLHSIAMLVWVAILKFGGA